MIFLVVAALTCASGMGLLRALRLGTGRLAVDLPLGWFAGGAWFAACGFSIRSLLGLRVNGAAAGVVLALPLLAWAARVRWGGGAEAPPTPGPARWIPRPTWTFAPMAAWSVAVAAAVALHGMATPTHTDDAYRVRAFAPVLAAEGIWSGPARELIAVAGPIPSFVPALPWLLGADVDPIHVNATIVLTFLALLALLVALSSARGRPEAGWGAVFAITSVPLLAYHATSTYSDAWLAAYLAAAFAFLVAYGQERDPADAGRALLLLLGVAMVKRVGEMVALPAIAVLLAQVAWDGKADRVRALRRWIPLLAAYGVVVAAQVAALGLSGAYPYLRAAANRSALAVQAPPSPAPAAAAAAASAGAMPASGGPSAAGIFVDALLGDGNLGLLFWVLALAVLLLAPKIGKEGLAWSGAALGLVLAESAAKAIWLDPAYTLDHTAVHRSLLPVSAAAAVWLASLLAAASRPAPAAPASRASRRSSKVG